MSQLGGGARKLSRVGIGGLSMVFFSFWLGRLARRYLGSNLCGDHTTMQWRGHTIKGIFRYSLMTWVVDVIFPRSSHLNFPFHLPLVNFLLNIPFILCHSFESHFPCEIFPFLQSLPLHPLFSAFLLSFVMVLSQTPHVSCPQYL